MTELKIACLRMAWQGETLTPGMAPFRTLTVSPEPAYPFGRKGLVLASAWRHLRESSRDGVLVWDGDVAADPVDLQAMLGHAGSEKDAVWTAPLRIWPRSTHLPAWVWGHRQALPPETPVARKLERWQADVSNPDWFTFGFTFLPGALMESCCDAGMDEWCFPNVDTRVRMKAKELGIRVRVARGCHVVHLNF